MSTERGASYQKGMSVAVETLLRRAPCLMDLQSALVRSPAVLHSSFAFKISRGSQNRYWMRARIYMWIVWSTCLLVYWSTGLLVWRSGEKAEQGKGDTQSRGTERRRTARGGWSSALDSPCVFVSQEASQARRGPSACLLYKPLKITVLRNINFYWINPYRIEIKWEDESSSGWEQAVRRTSNCCQNRWVGEVRGVDEPPAAREPPLAQLSLSVSVASSSTRPTGQMVSSSERRIWKIVERNDAPYETLIHIHIHVLY